MDEANRNHVAALSRAVAQNQVVVVAGAGVAAASTTTPEAGSWVALMQSGLTYYEGHVEDYSSTLADSIRADLADPTIGVMLTSAADKLTTALGGNVGPAFKQWLRESIGSAVVSEPQVIQAILSLTMPIATTNYDNLIETVGNRIARTWVEADDMQNSLFGRTGDIAHLHGVWTDTASVVFGAQSYGSVLGSAAAQSLERAMGTSKSMLFVGCGQGLADPNFDGLRKWIKATFPTSPIKHYRLCLESELVRLRLEHQNESIVPVTYGETHSDLTPFLRRIHGNTSAGSVIDTVKRTTDGIIRELRLQSIFADQMPDLDLRTMEQLIVPPVIIPVSHEQFAAAARDDDGPSVERIDARADLRAHKCLVIVGEEKSGLTTALQWLVNEASQIFDAAPLVLDFARFTGLTPVDRAARIAYRYVGTSVSGSAPIPETVLAIDNVVPSGNLAFQRLLAELPVSFARVLILGCPPGGEVALDQALRNQGLDPVTRYLGRLNQRDIKTVASLVAPTQADKLAEKAVEIIQREHLARTPLTVCLLVSLLIAGEALLSTASETALLDAYVNLLLGRGSTSDDARYTLDAHENIALLAQLAGKFVELDSGAVDEATAIATFADYFAIVGWTESATEALRTLIRRHVLVRRDGLIQFAQSSFLHLFAAKRALENSAFKLVLLDEPYKFSSVIKHYAALTRNDAVLVAKVGQLVSAEWTATDQEVSRGRSLSTIDHIGHLDAAGMQRLLTSLDRQVTLAEEATPASDGELHGPVDTELDPLDEVLDADPVPFPAADVHDAPPMVRIIQTLSLVSNVLRDSEQVQDLALKKQILADVLRLWGRLVDAIEGDEAITQFIGEVGRGFFSELGTSEDEIEGLMEHFMRVAPTLIAMGGMTASLSSRKLNLMLRNVLSDAEYISDAGIAVMGALLSFDVRQNGWAEAFTIAQHNQGEIEAVNTVLRMMATFAYLNEALTSEDADFLNKFLADQLSLRAGAAGTPDQKAAHAQIRLRLQRRRLQSALTSKTGVRS